jgi:hypothetical protein
MATPPIVQRRTPLGTLISPRWDAEQIAKVEAAEAAMGYPICGGKSKTQPGEVCKASAGFGTNHLGDGRCKFHGGSAPIKHGRLSLLRHRDISSRVEQFADDGQLMDIRNAVATTWATLDTLLEDDATITPDRAQDIINAMSRVSNMIKQHHDITVGQKITIEVPQFMEWAENLYELAIKYLMAVGGDVRGFLAEAQQYYSSAVAIVTGDSPPAIGPGDSFETEELLRPGEPEPGSAEGAA